MSQTTYISQIADVTKSLFVGIRITLKHFFQATKQRKPLSIEHPEYFQQDTGLFTTLYPHEALPIPDHGRNRLHNEIDDCIVCDLCAKICPVNCIDIVPIKSAEEIGKTSDGSSKRLYAAKFDIDMAKCCYCGLCTTVCPTECLTMTNAFDYSEFDVGNMIYNFSDLSPAQAKEKQEIYNEAQRLKAEAKAKKAATEVKAEPSAKATIIGKPVFKPTIKAPIIPNNTIETGESKQLEKEKTNEYEPKKIVFKPTIKPLVKPIETEQSSIDDVSPRIDPPKPKPVFKPVIKIPLPKKPNADLDSSTLN